MKCSASGSNLNTKCTVSTLYSCCQSDDHLHSMLMGEGQSKQVLSRPPSKTTPQNTDAFSTKQLCHVDDNAGALAKSILEKGGF
jgi:hypothetical protein